MKKLFALILALTLVLALAACTSNEPAETQPKETQPKETQPQETEPEETQPEIEFAQYTYVEDRGDFKVTWVFTRINDAYSLDETNGMSGETVTHGISEITYNEDGTLTTGEWSDADSNKSEFFAPNGVCTWIIGEDGKTFKPVNEGEGSSSNEGSVNPGKYAIGDTGWNLMLKGSGEFMLQDPDGNNYDGTEWTDNGDCTVTTGALVDPSTAPDFLNGGDGSGTWTINEDGTATLG